jgi:hypothetical protein
MFEGFMPPSISCRISVGRITPFGTGLVISQISIHALLHFLDNSVRGCPPVGFSKADFKDISGFWIDGIGFFRIIVMSHASGNSSGKPVLP